MNQKKPNYRYVKRLGIPTLLKKDNKLIPALMIFGTYKTYPLNLFHMEFIIAMRTGNNILNLWMDDENIILYYTL